MGATPKRANHQKRPPIWASTPLPAVAPRAVDLTTTKYQTTNLIDILAMLGSIGAGGYLLQYTSSGQASGTSWFEIIAHGMGLYFIAKGLFMGRSTYLQADARNKLAQLVELAQGAQGAAAEVEKASSGGVPRVVPEK